MKVGEIWAPTEKRIKDMTGWFSPLSIHPVITKENAEQYGARWHEGEGNVRILEMVGEWIAQPGMKEFVVFEYVGQEKDNLRMYEQKQSFLQNHYKVYES